MLKLMPAFTLAMVGAAAWAASPEASCLDPAASYVARPLNHHQIYAEQTFGKKKPPIRLTTSCYHLESADAFGLSAAFRCIAQGDIVVATIGSERQSCRVLKVEPYAAREGDKSAKPDNKADSES